MAHGFWIQHKSKFDHLTMDALTAPAWVLAYEPHNPTLNLGIDPWPTSLAALFEGPLRCTSLRCQLSTVLGLNRSMVTESRSRQWAMFARKCAVSATNGNFSQHSKTGPGYCLRSTIRSCCRNSMISISFSLSAIRRTSARSSTNDQKHNSN